MTEKDMRAAEAEIQAFAASLSPEEKVLIDVRDELYGGDWVEMVADLQARLEGKPYIFKLATRIEEDLLRIEKLKAFEEKQHINLRDYV
jgi:hypothetical protein